MASGTQTFEDDIMKQGIILNESLIALTFVEFK